MKLISFIPAPALQPLISTFGMMYADFEAANILTSYPFPWSPQIRLNFTIQGQPLQIQKQGSEQLTRLPACSLIGPQLGGNTIYFENKCAIACVCFNPGAFFRLTGIGVNELVNQDLDAIHVFGNGIKQVQQQLQSVSDPVSIKRMIEGFLLKRLQQTAASILPFDLALLEWMKMSGGSSISEMAAASCLSIKQFERSCNQRLGINPKLFARLLRFSRAYALAERQSDHNWAGIAQESGYHDQMHLIHDFRQFAGITPGMILQNLPNSIRLIHLLETDRDTHVFDEFEDEYRAQLVQTNR